MNVATIARPLQMPVRWLVAGLLALALALFAATVHSTPVGAAVWCGGQYTTYCPLSVGYYPGYAGYLGYGFAPNAVVYRQYTDNRSNCPDGQVTQTPTGYFCTNYGIPAFVPGTAPVYAGYPGYAGYFPGYAGYNPYLAYRPYCAC